MDDKQKFALFKFQVISPVLNNPSIEQKQYFQNEAKKVYDLDFTFRKSFSPLTFKKWLAEYRKLGFEGLCSDGRKDRGLSRSITEDLKLEIARLTAEFDFRTVKNLYHYLLREKTIEKEQFTYATLNSFVRKNNLFHPAPAAKPRKAFETEHINRLWTCDFMVGPSVYDGKKKFTAYLCAIIDDYSRLIVSASFHDTQSVLALENTLKKAVLTYGIPDRFYCDNGKVFSGHYIHLISARLGFTLVHSKPYEASSRGKIERYFRTVRDCFLQDFLIRHKNIRFTMDMLDSSFKEWLFQGYNNLRHSAIDDTPINRFMRDLEQVKVRKLENGKIMETFLHTIYRSVNNDATISFRSRLYQVPARFIGKKKVEFRFDPESPVLFLYENNTRVIMVKLLDKHENSKFPVHFRRDEITGQEAPNV